MSGYVTPKGDRKILVLDFDHTLATHHFYNIMENLNDGFYLPPNRQEWIYLSRDERFSNRELIEWVFGSNDPNGVNLKKDADHLKMIVRNLNYLKTMDVDLSIATAGYSDWVIRILDQLDEWGYNISPRIFEEFHSRNRLGNGPESYHIIGPNDGFGFASEKSKAKYVKNLILTGKYGYVAYADDQREGYLTLNSSENISLIDIEHNSNGLSDKNWDQIMNWANHVENEINCSICDSSAHVVSDCMFNYW